MPPGLRCLLWVYRRGALCTGKPGAACLNERGADQRCDERATFSEGWPPRRLTSTNGEQIGGAMGARSALPMRSGVGSFVFWGIGGIWGASGALWDNGGATGTASRGVCLNGSPAIDLDALLSIRRILLPYHLADVRNMIPARQARGRVIPAVCGIGLARRQGGVNQLNNISRWHCVFLVVISN